MRFRAVYGLVVVSGLFAGAALAAFDGAADVGAGRGPDVVINELMVNPHRTYDSRGEWIELYNRGDEAADLEGWTIGDEIYDDIVLPSIVIEPGGFALLARNGDTFRNGGVAADYVYGNSIILWNTDDLLVLRDADGTERDVVDYRAAGFTVPDGRSMALVDPALDNGDGASWCASTTVMARGDLGSPGAANRCTLTVHPLVITEILQNPGATSDYAGEWFEVHNPGTEPVDMNGYTIKDDDHDHFVVDGTVVVPAGGYALFGASATANGSVALDFAYGDGMRLYNDSDELVIADRDGVQVDRVRWDDGRTFPDPNGASMSLADPNADNALGENWCTATTAWAVGDQGTPGLPTWCSRPGEQPIVITEIMFDPELPKSERNSEWFEIANLGEQAVDLSGWTIIGGDFLTHTISSLVVAPGESAVLAANGDLSVNGGVEADYVYGAGVPLYNKSGRVVLESTTGAVVDRVDWSAARGFPIPKGSSIALGFASGDNALGANWCESVDRYGDGDLGTPGAANSCEQPAAAAELEISEIMRNPAVVGDSVGEWIEIHNPTTADVDLEGWAIDDGASDVHTITRQPGRRRRRLRRHRPIDRHRPQRRCAGRLLVPGVVRARQRRRLDRAPRRARHHGRRGELGQRRHVDPTERRVDGARRRRLVRVRPAVRRRRPRHARGGERLHPTAPSRRGHQRGPHRPERRQRHRRRMARVVQRDRRADRHQRLGVARRRLRRPHDHGRWFPADPAGRRDRPRPRSLDEDQRRRPRCLQLRLGLPAQRHDRRDLAPRRRPRAGRSRDVDGVPPAAGGARRECRTARSGGRQLRHGELVHVGDHVRNTG